jgi:hypothetical protein
MLGCSIERCSPLLETVFIMATTAFVQFLVAVIFFAEKPPGSSTELGAST